VALALTRVSQPASSAKPARAASVTPMRLYVDPIMRQLSLKELNGCAR